MSLPFFVLTTKQKIEIKKISHQHDKDTSGVIDLASDNRNRISQVISAFPCRDDIMSFLNERAGSFGRMNIIMVVLTVNLLLDTDGDFDQMVNLFYSELYTPYREHFISEAKDITGDRFEIMFRNQLEIYATILMPN